MEVKSVVNVIRTGFSNEAENFNVEVRFIEAQIPETICLNIESGIIFSAC